MEETGVTEAGTSSSSPEDSEVPLSVFHFRHRRGLHSTSRMMRREAEDSDESLGGKSWTTAASADAGVPPRRVHWQEREESSESAMTEADPWERSDPWLRPPDIGTYANENWSSDMWTFKKKRGTYEEGTRATNEHLAKMRQKLQKKTHAAEVVDAGGQDVAGRSSMDIFASGVEDADESAFMPGYYRPGEATGPGLGCPDYPARHRAAFESMHLQATQKGGWMSCPGTCGVGRAWLRVAGQLGVAALPARALATTSHGGGGVPRPRWPVSGDDGYVAPWLQEASGPREHASVMQGWLDARADLEQL